MIPTAVKTPATAPLLSKKPLLPEPFELPFVLPLLRPPVPCGRAEELVEVTVATAVEG